MLSIDLISLVLAVVIYSCVRTSTSFVIALFFLFYIGYTNYMVSLKPYGNYYDFFILQMIVYIAGFMYMLVSKLRRGADIALIAIFGLMFIYLAGMQANWYVAVEDNQGSYGFFDSHYTPFMIGCYISLFLFEINAERIPDKVVNFCAKVVNKIKHNRNQKVSMG